MGTQKLVEVMAVDDDPDIRFVTRKILEREGYNVVEATTGGECLDKIKERKPDVILMDVKLPDIDGWEVCKKIKENKKTSSIPVVMFTAMSRKEDMDKSFKYAGADGHIPRPFKRKTLTDMLKCLEEEPKDIMSKLNKVVEKEERRREVLKMLNPKLMDYKYEF